VAALARGDEKEENRLARSAPRTTFSVPDFYGLAQGVQSAATFFMLDLLDLAGLFWRAEVMWAESAAFNEEEAPSKWCEATTQMWAYLITAKLDGWRQFCTELKADPELLIRGLPGSRGVKRIEETARGLTFTREEATAWVRGRGDEQAEVIDAGTVAADLWAVVNSWAASWE
jgi:hypothetical protein